MIMNKPIVTSYGSFFLLSVFLSGSGVAALLDLETTPLFLDSSEKANLMLVMDDSGSMDWEISIADTTDGVLWWSETATAFVGADQLGQINQHLSGFDFDDGPHFYLFPNGTVAAEGADRRWYGDVADWARAIPPFVQYAFTRTAEINRAYYNHNVTYEPWSSSQYGGTVYSDMDPANALSDPDTGDVGDTNAAKFDLTQNVESFAVDHTFGVYTGMVVPAGARYYNGAAWVAAGSDVTQIADAKLGVSYYPATYYTIVASGSYSMGGGHGCASPDANQYVAFRSAPSTFSSTDADALAPDGSCLKKVEIKPATSSYPHNGERTDCVIPSTCTYAEEIQNFANWFSYHRKRYLSLRAAMGSTFKNIGGVYAGLFTINNVDDGSQGNVTMLDLDVATDNLNLFDLIYSIDAGGGTPNREGLDFAGQQLMRTDANAPVQNSCQKNFALQFTDGYSQTSTSSGAGNADGSAGAPYSDTYSNTLADIAYKYYSTPLRTGAGFSLGQIDPPSGCADSTLTPWLDCNTDLHMNTYGIVLGGVGKDIFSVNDGGVVRTTVADAYANPPTWPDVNTIRNATQIDDLYHATVNGRGEMFRASSPQELTTSLKQALESIKEQAGSASKVSFNSSALNAGSLIYAAGFDAEKWSGDVTAYALDKDNGELSTSPSWSASDDWLDKASGGLSHTARTILTHNGTQGVGFKWSNWSKLNANQRADMNAASTGTAHEVIDYIRGDRSNEGSSGFRTRGSVLGDFVYSNLVYVGKPPLKWPDSPLFAASSGPSQYSDYRLALINNPRKEMIYIGGNDGMLHGFVASAGDIDSGKELLAYIPGSVFSSDPNAGLHYLTKRDYTHQFYVDLSPTVSDVILNNKWSTILVGGERSGGRSIFALNVTNPGLFGDDDAKAANTVLWEFSEADLGYTYSKPTIVKLNNGKWGAVFGNGYNNTGSGEAKLFIVEIEPGGTWNEGINYHKLNTGVGSVATPNGLATPAVVDLDGNGTAARVYAGDLRGNMWTFDISNASASNWKSKYENLANAPVPLFKAQYGTSPAVDQPITAQPVAVLHPTIPTDPGNNEPNVMLFFGTGQYLQIPDIMNTSGTQSFYGVWDRGTAELTRAGLQSQTLLDESNADTDGNVLRVLSDNAVDYSPVVASDQQYGWYFDLPASGERSVLPAYVRGDLVFYNTWIPSTPPCTAGGSGYLMSVSQTTGGAPSETAFDITGDGIVDGSDEVSFGGNTSVPAGKAFNNGLPTGSGFLDDFRYTGGTQLAIGATLGGCVNGICKDKLRPLGGIKTGRLSWQELGRD
jgi:type IV pilus assembly protein PilY1